MNRSLLTFCLSLCLMLLTACQSVPKPQGLTAQVERVLSGQTVEVGGAAASQRVRLIGIDAPDLEQLPWGTAARDRLEQLIAGATVLLETDAAPTDPQNRLLAYLWRDGVLINQQLVAEGLVLAAVRSPNFKYDQQFAQAQEKARALGLGIWNPQQPMRQTPSEFRKANR
jgi:micrococcal nuclease